MRVAKAIAFAGIVGVVAASVPARADEDDHGGWRRHEWREQRWREHEWREHHWRGFAPPPVAYAPPGYYYAPPRYYQPPPVVYAPPPMYQAPGFSIGFGFR